MKKKFNANALTLLLLSFSASTLAESTVTNQFDALTQDGSGNTRVTAMTPDGKFFVGYADTDTPNEQHAVVWYSTGNKLDLGNKGVVSTATGISDDGKFITFNLDVAAGLTNAYVIDDTGIPIPIPIPDLDGNLGGNSKAMAISGDGRVVVGTAEQTANTVTVKHAFIYDVSSSQMVEDLGTLKSDDSGNSIANAISLQGKSFNIVGSADNDNGDNHAALWYTAPNNAIKKVDLNTLKTKGAGSSNATAVSTDGKFIAGSSDTDTNEKHAVRWVGDANHNYSIENLGTLKTNGTGTSEANAITADGSFVAGTAENDSNEMHAVRWSWDNSSNLQKVDLGTLKKGDAGKSEANAISTDGSVVVGSAENDNGVMRAVVWKITGGNTPTPPPPGPPGPQPSPAAKIVDVFNSQLTMLDSAAKGMRALALYQGAISGLSDTRCQLGADTYCVGAFSQFDHTQHNNMTTTGLFGAIRLLPSEKLTAGGSVNFSDPTNLVSGYDTKGSSKPGVGIFTRWQDNTDGSGLTVDVSGAFIQNNATIRREQLSYTEAGAGTAKIKGWQTKGTVSWGMKVGDSTLISPVTGLSWQEISRSAYTENRDAAFAASYGEMANKELSLNTGVQISHKASSNVTLNGSVGTEINLSRKRKAFTGALDYMGKFAFAFDNGEKRELQPYAQAGISVKLTSNSTLNLNAGWQETDYRSSSVRAALSYSYHW